MASPQIENGHIDIANEIAEALARIRLSGEEVQVLWVILRKTYGWHKKTDKISLSQFSEATGMSRKHVLRAINKLSPKMVIAVTKNGDREPNTYEFIKDFDKWVLSPKKGISPKMGPRLSPILGTTKENSTKENTTDILSLKNRDKISSSQLFVAHPLTCDSGGPSEVLPKDEKPARKKSPAKVWAKDDPEYTLSEFLFDQIVERENHIRFSRMTNGDREKTIQSWAKDMDRLMRIDKYEEETVGEVIQWATEDSFWRTNVLSGATLRKQFDRLIVQMRKGGRR